MIDISLNNITKNYSFGNVLSNVSFDCHSGEIISLVGSNGSGKSTLLKIINGEEKPTSGTISIRKNATIGYLSQLTENLPSNIKVKDILYKSINELTEIEEKLKQYEEKMQLVTDKDLEKLIVKYTNLQDKYILLGGYEQEEKIGKIVNGFKINHLLESNYNILSGGEKRIVSFATLIVNNPDILLLDEPTNHLDIETLEWLENYLSNYKGTIIIVSHDRYFLDKISKKVILLSNGNIDIFFWKLYLFFRRK